MYRKLKTPDRSTRARRLSKRCGSPVVESKDTRRHRMTRTKHSPTYKYRKLRLSRHKRSNRPKPVALRKIRQTTHRLYRPKPVDLRKIRPYQKKSMIHKLPFHVKRVTIKDIQLARRIRGEGLHSLNWLYWYLFTFFRATILSYTTKDYTTLLYIYHCCTILCL